MLEHLIFLCHTSLNFCPIMYGIFSLTIPLTSRLFDAPATVDKIDIFAISLSLSLSFLDRHIASILGAM